MMNSNAFGNVPYIGVTDVASHSQVQQMIECIPKSVSRRLHVGVMMSRKTLLGIKTKTGWENIWPRDDALRAIFQPHPRVFNVLHYADYDMGDACQTTSEHLIRACEEAGPHLQGLQLDMIWPRPGMLAEVKSRFPNLEIILQVGKTAMTELLFGVGPLREGLKPYLSSSDYFLLDHSMGKGLLMSSVMLDFVEESLLVVPPERLAVAGGLGPNPNSLTVLKKIFALSKNISCDAQGQMRTSGSATDPIEIDRACAYIKGVCLLL